MAAKPQTGQEKEISLTVLPQYQIVSDKEVLPYPIGTVFEEGMAAYFYAVSPRLLVTPTIAVEGMDEGTLNGTIGSRVVLQAVDDKAQIYWQYALADYPSRNFTLTNGQSTQESQLSYQAGQIGVEVASAYNKAMQIADQLLFQNGVIQVVIISDLQVQGTANGHAVQKSAQLNLVLTLQQSYFSILKSQDASVTAVLAGGSKDTGSDQSAAAVLWQQLPLLALDLILLLLYLGMLWYDNQKQSKTELYHKRYKEWITEGSVEASSRHQQVNILNLEGLVDLAIDLNKRVIYDGERAQYFVLTEDIEYLFDPKRLKALHEGRKKLGRLLLELELINREQLEIGLYYHKKTGRRLGECLIALEFVDEATLYRTLAAQQNIDYYELEEAVPPKIDWQEKVSIQKARAMRILPLGRREDGKLVIASGESDQEGIVAMLQDIFQTEIIVVAARPSVIERILERQDAREQEAQKKETDVTGGLIQERLSGEERERFYTSYRRGQIDYLLFFKAAGLITTELEAKAPEQQDILSWLSKQRLLEPELLPLVMGLDKAIDSMPVDLRKRKLCPSVLDILYHADYLTKTTKEYMEQESKVQGLPPEQLLVMNYYAAKTTIEKVMLLQKVLNYVLVEIAGA